MARGVIALTKAEVLGLPGAGPFRFGLAMPPLTTPADRHGKQLVRPWTYLSTRPSTMAITKTLRNECTMIPTHALWNRREG